MCDDMCVKLVVDRALGRTCQKHNSLYEDHCPFQEEDYEKTSAESVLEGVHIINFLTLWGIPRAYFTEKYNDFKQLVTKNTFPLKIANSDEYGQLCGGAGIFTKEDIHRSLQSNVLPCNGETVSLDEANRDEDMDILVGDEGLSIIMRGGKWCVLIGPLRFINHSCEPNCMYVSRTNSMGLEAVLSVKLTKRNDPLIKADVHITVNYDRDSLVSPFGDNCKCSPCLSDDDQLEDVSETMEVDEDIDDTPSSPALSFSSAAADRSPSQGNDRLAPTSNDDHDVWDTDFQNVKKDLSFLVSAMLNNTDNQAQFMSVLPGFINHIQEEVRKLQQLCDNQATVVNEKPQDAVEPVLQEAIEPLPQNVIEPLPQNVVEPLPQNVVEGIEIVTPIADGEIPELTAEEMTPSIKSRARGLSAQKRAASNTVLPFVILNINGTDRKVIFSPDEVKELDSIASVLSNCMKSTFRGTVVRGEDRITAACNIDLVVSVDGVERGVEMKFHQNRGGTVPKVGSDKDLTDQVNKQMDALVEKNMLQGSKVYTVIQLTEMPIYPGVIQEICISHHSFSQRNKSTSNTIRYNCWICQPPHDFKKASRLALHHPLHTDAHLCEECDPPKRFASEKSRHEHMYKKHQRGDSQPEQAICPTCHQEMRKINLLRHIEEKHTLLGRHKCTKRKCQHEHCPPRTQRRIQHQ